VREADEGELVRRLSRELDRRHRLVQAHGIERIGGRRLSHYRFRHILFQRYVYSGLDEVERAQRLARARQELGLQLALGMAWVGRQAYGPQGERAYNRARELSQQLGEVSQLCLVLGRLAFFHYVRCEHQKARALAEEALSLAQRTQDPLHEALGHRYLGAILLCLGEYTTARAHFAQMISFYDPQQHHRALVSLRGSDAGTSALAYDACCLWCLGYPEQALRQGQAALVLARRLGHPWSLADVLWYAGGMLGELRGESDLEPGECTWLQWEVDYVREVYLEGKGVIGPGHRQVCPQTTTRFELEVIHRDGTVTWHTVEIEVAGHEQSTWARHSHAGFPALHS
jgi:tetratricopeptide (TPR) repeat protein